MTARAFPPAQVAQPSSDRGREKRKVGRASQTHLMGQFAALCLQQRRCLRNRNCLRDGANLQRHIHAHNGLRLHIDRRPHELFESRHIDTESVLARRKIGDIEFAPARRSSHGKVAPVPSFFSSTRALGNDGSRRVGNCSRNRRRPIRRPTPPADSDRPAGRTPGVRNIHHPVIVVIELPVGTRAARHENPRVRPLKLNLQPVSPRIDQIQVCQIQICGPSLRQSSCESFSAP